MAHGLNLATQLIDAHRLEGTVEPEASLALNVDQTLTQDATGTLVMLELEGMGVGRVRTELSAQYVDHNLVQEDFKNQDDHLFLRSACQRFGVWYSRAGNGVSHPVHQQNFGQPGKTLLGSDSHTCAAGALGMLAIGAGGLEVAFAMAGYPFRLKMPEIWGVELVGKLPEWVSAKDVILELLRRHGVSAGLGRIIEYHGAGVETLTVMDRHVIANMGAELGATTSVFPADDQTGAYLERHGRAQHFRELRAEPGAVYSQRERIDLSELEPLMALPSSPGNVVAVSEAAGEPIHQSYIGSSANPGYRDLAIAAAMVCDKTVAEQVSFDINPSSRRLLEELTHSGALLSLLQSGARLHQAGCNGCIGMGQAPGSGKLSLRTVPRNFPGRSGTKDDRVCLVSPETATASALTGVVTDPRQLGLRYPGPEKLRAPALSAAKSNLVQQCLLVPPVAHDEGKPRAELAFGPNIKPLPELEALEDHLELSIALRVGDDMSTDEILPAGAKVLPYRSNIEKISDFAFASVDPEYPQKARRLRAGHAIVAGANYGQGSSREHAALAPRYLGLKLVLAKSFARIHRQNLINFGVLPLRFCNPDDYEDLSVQGCLVIDCLREDLQAKTFVLRDKVSGKTLEARHELSSLERERIATGGVVNGLRKQRLSAKNLGSNVDPRRG